MNVSDKAYAERFIQYIGYYRLSGYALLLEQPGSTITVSGINLYQRTHTFKPGTTFEDLQRLYEVDRLLRLNLFGALERIEIALRNEMCNYMAITYTDSHWYLNKGHFNSRFKVRGIRGGRPEYDKFIEQIERETGKNNPARQTTFCATYYARYSTPDLPPVWMVAEQLSMGVWSRVYEALDRRSDRKAVADYFDVSPADFASWARALSYLRNLCAHHMRILGITFVITPANSAKIPTTIKNTDFAMFAAIIHLLLKKIALDNQWATTLQQVLQAHPYLQLERSLGFRGGWGSEAFWR